MSHSAYTVHAVAEFVVLYSMYTLRLQDIVQDAGH